MKFNEGPLVKAALHICPIVGCDLPLADGHCGRHGKVVTPVEYCPKCGRPTSEPHCGFGDSWQ